MKKKNTTIIIASIVFVVVLIIGVIDAVNRSTITFQSRSEMSKVINGTWRTGDSEYDFIITICDSSMILEMGSGDRPAEEYNIILVPEKGYFYTKTNTDNLYKVDLKDGRYIIETEYWTYEKVK